MLAFDLVQGTVLAVVVLVAWGIAAWIGGAVLAGWVASQAGREPVTWLAIALVLSPAVALVALAGLPTVAAAQDQPRTVAQERRLRAVNSL